jgi:orotate phosphoribosyltransferase
MSWCKQFLIDNCVERSRPDRPIISSTGQRNSWQLFPRRALYDARFSLEAGRRLYELIQLRLGNTEGWQLAGMESGAVPLLVAIGQEYQRQGRALNVFSVRKERKSYGIFNRFEGNPRRELVTVLVDDAVKTGRSVRLCREILENEGFMVLEDCYCVVGSGEHVHSLYTFDELGLKG